jgi:hypothetical protein
VFEFLPYPFSSSLIMMVQRRNLIVARRSQIYQILGFHLVSRLLAVVLSTYRELLTLKVVCHY